MWKKCRFSTKLAFQDNCDTLHCTQQCPDMLEFNQFLAPEYPGWAKLVLSSLVVTVAAVSIILKVSVLFEWKAWNNRSVLMLHIIYVARNNLSYN